MDIEDLVNYYTNLLIYQYRDKPKAKATIEALVREILSDMVFTAVRDAFDVNTALGKQLDILGKIVGIDREFWNMLITRPEPVFGYSFGGEVAEGVEGYGYGGYTRIYWVSVNLSDSDFRQLIKMRIIQNTSDHSLKSINDYLQIFYNDAVSVTEGGNMLIIYHFPLFMRSAMDIAWQKEVLPAPAGVDILLAADRNPNGEFGFSLAGVANDAVNGYGFKDYVGGSYLTIYRGASF